MRKRLASYRQQNPLAFRLAGAILLVSALITVISIALLMAREYRQGVSRIEGNLRQLQVTALPGLSRALWNFDEAQLQVQLDALLRLPEIHSVSVHWQHWTGEPRTLTLDDQQASSGIDQFHQYPLSYRRPDGSNEQLGNLVLGLSHQQIYQRAGQQALFVVVFHGLQALIIALLILVLLRQLITRRLGALADYTRRLSLATLHRQPPSHDGNGPRDELDDISDALDTMRETLLDDIRQRQQSEQALLDERELRLEHEERRIRAESANQTKDALIAVIGQHIRTPLNTLLGGLDLLGDTPLNPQQRHYLSLLLQSGDNLHAISNDILDYARLESGQLTLLQQPVDLLALIEQCATSFAASAADKKLELICELRLAQLRRVRADASRLRQIFLNLIGNAVKFTASGQVLIRAWEQQNNQQRWLLRVEIQDSGVGISEQQQQHIFEPFMQGKQANAQPTNQPGDDGRGLGLSVCRALCALMKGRLGVQSEPGQGAFFWVELPLQQDNQEAATLPVDSCGGTVKVLSAHPALRHSLCQMLDWLGASSEPGHDLGSLRHSGNSTIILVDESLCQQPQLLLPYADKIIVLGKAPTTHPVLRSLAKPVTQSALEAMLGQQLPAREADSTRVAHWRFDHLRVLLIADNPLTREITAAMFDTLRVQTMLCATGSDALATYRQNPERYPLLLVDMDLTDQNALALCRQLHQQQRQAGVRSQILALSSQTPAIDAATQKAHGIDQVLEKPLRKDALLQWLIEQGGGKRLDVLESNRSQDS